MPSSLRSPLIQALVDEHRYELLTEQNIDAFLERHGNVVLFFSENPRQFPESNDVAVILPEVVRQYDGRLTAGVVDAEAEHRLQQRYGFTTWPALVLLRRGEYLGVITGMQDWGVYGREFKRLLTSAPTPPPIFTVPVVAESGSDCQ